MFFKLTIHKLPCYGIVVEVNDVGYCGTIMPGQLTHHIFEGITSMVLAHAIAGVDIEDPRYLEGIETAVENVEGLLDESRS